MLTTQSNGIVIVIILPLLEATVFLALVYTVVTLFVLFLVQANGT